MIASIDVCGAMEILLQKKKAGKFSSVLREAEIVTAPDLYIAELSNAFWKYHVAKILTKDECMQYIQDGINFVDDFIDSKEVWSEAFSEGINNGHSIYDMLYMVVARRNSGLLITNDSVLAAICKKNHVQICY
jgi:predicted nucleic acid-binding protein